MPFLIARLFYNLPVKEIISSDYLEEYSLATGVLAAIGGDDKSCH